VKNSTFTVLAYSQIPQTNELEKEKRTTLAISMRALAAAREGDLVLLPDHKAARELVSFYEKALLNRKLNVLWVNTKEVRLDNNITEDKSLIKEIQDVINFKIKQNIKCFVWPYSYTTHAAAWIKQLQGVEQVVAETPAFTSKYANKDIFHPYVTSPEEKPLLHGIEGVNIPKGYICRSYSEMELAIEKLREEGVLSFLAKPMTGVAGRGVTAIKTKEDIYALTIEEPYILSEKLAIDFNEDIKTEVNCSIEVRGGEIFGPPTGQLIRGTTWIGGTVPSLDAPWLLHEANVQAERILAVLRKKGLRANGGFDFVGTTQKACYIIDNNLTRETGTHFPKYFQEKYASGVPFVCTQVASPKKNIYKVWEELQQKDLAFSVVTKKGVFPIIHVPGEITMLICFDETSKKALDTLTALTL
jgi:hypothetical protein